MGGKVKAAGKLLCVVLAGAVVVPIQLVANTVHRPTSRRTPWLFHRSMLRLIGLRVTIVGKPETGTGIFYVSNHSSYVDILVLGAKLEAFFVAKSEVAGWPFFGWLARAGRTIFVQRERRATTGDQRNELLERMGEGDNIILFPEGTSNDGNRIEPFKSALLSVAEGTLPDGSSPLVQPVVVIYTGVHGIPMGRAWRPKFAWYGDMELMPHLFELMQIGPCEAELHFLEPVRAGDFPSRKELTAHCHKVIGDRLGAVLQHKPWEAA